MIKRVNELFAGHANLIAGFTAFLPPAHARTGSRQFKVRGINAFPLLICCQTINVEVLKILLAQSLGATTKENIRKLRHFSGKHLPVVGERNRDRF